MRLAGGRLAAVNLKAVAGASCCSCWPFALSDCSLSSSPQCLDDASISDGTLRQAVPAAAQARAGEAAAADFAADSGAGAL
jgi:hypothetical protein